MNIVILDDYQDAVRKLECTQRINQFTLKIYTNTTKGIGQLTVRLRDADCVILLSDRTPITKHLLDKLPKLRLIVQIGPMSPHIDLKACTARGVAVTTNPLEPTATAEFTWALIMTAMRRLPQYISNLKHGAWQQSGFKAAAMPDNFGLGNCLQGKTLGIWGYGKIGQIIAGYAKAFGMQVLIWGSAASQAQAKQDGFKAAESKAALFMQSDVLSLHLQFSAKTRYCITARDLASMKRTALLVNTAHAELIEADALANALQKGRPGLAAVDVFESEPILQGHTLLRLENCICTPHLSYVEQTNYEEQLGQAFDKISAYFQGKPIDVCSVA